MAEEMKKVVCRLETVEIKRINVLNPNDIYPLVIESEREGFRFVRRLYDDYINETNRFNRNGEALFVAQLSDQLVGVCGLNQDPYVQGSKVGRVRRLYVHPSFRKLGIGKLLVSRVIEEAKHFFVTLTLRTDNPIADKFYRSIGFLTDHSFKGVTHFLSLDVPSD